MICNFSVCYPICGPVRGGSMRIMSYTLFILNSAWFRITDWNCYLKMCDVIERCASIHSASFFLYFSPSLQWVWYKRINNIISLWMIFISSIIGLDDCHFHFHPHHHYLFALSSSFRRKIAFRERKRHSASSLNDIPNGDTQKVERILLLRNNFFRYIQVSEIVCNLRKLIYTPTSFIMTNYVISSA